MDVDIMKTILFDQTHDEGSIIADKGEDGLSFLYKALGQKFNIQIIDTAFPTKIRAHALVIPFPKISFKPEEIDTINEFVDSLRDKLGCRLPEAAYLAAQYYRFRFNPNAFPTKEDKKTIQKTLQTLKTP